MNTSNKKQIIIFVGAFVPAYKAGGPIQSVKSIVESLGNQYNFLIITSAYEIDNTPLNVQPDVILDKGKFKVVYLKNKSMLSIFKYLQTIHVDYLLLNSFFSWQFSIKPLLLNIFFTKASLILAPRGEFSPGALRFKKFKKSLYVFLFKLFFIRYIHKFHATSISEVMHIKKIFPICESKIVQANNLRTVEINEMYFNVSEKEDNLLKIVFYSRLVPKKNLDYALEVLQTLAGNMRFHFDIYGTIEDIHYWKMCQSLTERMPTNIEVNYRGELKPSDVIKTLSDYDCFFFPTRGENFGHVILEAMMAGLPVIISNETPFNNIKENNCGWSYALTENGSFRNLLLSLAGQKRNDFLFYKKNLRNYLEAYALRASKDLDSYKSLFK